MPGRFAASTCSWLLAFTLLALSTEPLAGEDSGGIVKPRNGAWVPEVEIDLIAKAEEGHLLLDGEPVETDRPFPGVLHARVHVATGKHSLRLDTPGGSDEIIFFAGPSPPFPSAAPFVDHPPTRIDCTHCHAVSRRGRFRFNGGCQSCHTEGQFIRTHSHAPHELSSCGMCHDAHGSTVAKLLIVPKETACKQCHN